MQLHQLLMLADFDVMKVVMTVLVPAIWLIAQLMSGRDQAKGRPQAKARPQPPPPAPKQGVPQVKPLDPFEPVPPPKPNSLEEALRREVDDFLRRAQGKPAAQPEKRVLKKDRQRTTAVKTTETQGSKEGGAAQPLPLSERRPLSQPTSAMGGSLPSEAAKAKLDAAEKSTTWGSSVSQHVAEHMGGDRIQAHAEQLGDDVALADERMEEHLHSVFDHRLGQLSSKSVSPQRTSQRSTVASEVRDLIRRPGGMRQLIIASEILRRPEDRL